MGEIRPRKTQGAEMKRVAALLSAPVAKNKVSNYLIIVKISSKIHFLIDIDKYFKGVKV